MAITRATIDAKMEAAVSALEAEQYATAIKYALSAQALLSVLPDSRGADSQITWPAGRIDEFIRNLRRQQTVAELASSGAVRTSKITYVRPTDE